MPAPPQVLHGVVVSSGKMMRAVKVRTARQVYNSFLKKHFLTHQNFLVSDPNSSLRTGDVVKIAAVNQVSRNIKHVVTSILAPWGPAVDQRPPLLNEEERTMRRMAKFERRKERRVEDQREGSRDGRDGEVGSQGAQKVIEAAVAVQ